MRWAILLLGPLITNGTVDGGDPAVVAIVTKDGSAAHCTGTLIAPHTVLTAGHCAIDDSNFDGYRVFFGASIAGGGTFAEITDARIHPAFDIATLANDYGLLTIRETAPAAPIALDPRAPDASWVGQTFQVVGFGVTAAGASDAGQKRSGTASVSQVTSADFTATPAPSQPCTLDSGGPALFGSYVTGVVSHGDVACNDHVVFARVDAAQTTFIQPYLAATAPGSAMTGDPCFYDAQCTAGPCLQAADEPRRSFCSRPCTTRADCPSVMICAADGCRYPPPSPGAPGWSCMQPSDCAHALCVSGLCTRRCVPVGQDCPSGFECARAGGIDFFCQPELATDPGCQCQATRAAAPSGIVLLLLVIVAGRPGRRRAASRARNRAR